MSTTNEQKEILDISRYLPIDASDLFMIISFSALSILLDVACLISKHRGNFTGEAWLAIAMAIFAIFVVTVSLVQKRSFSLEIFRNWLRQNVKSYYLVLWPADNLFSYVNDYGNSKVFYNFIPQEEYRGPRTGDLELAFPLNNSSTQPLNALYSKFQTPEHLSALRFSLAKQISGEDMNKPEELVIIVTHPSGQEEKIAAGKLFDLLVEIKRNPDLGQMIAAGPLEMASRLWPSARIGLKAISETLDQFAKTPRVGNMTEAQPIIQSLKNFRLIINKFLYNM